MIGSPSLRPAARLVIAALCAASTATCARVAGIAETSLDNAAELFRPAARVVDKIQNPVVPGARLAALWVGHSTVLLQIDGRQVLTDPVFTSSVGQFVTRLVEPGLDLDALPPLDAVLVSHMHMDHLSLGTIEEIAARTSLLVVPEEGLVYTPRGPFEAVELATWQSVERSGLTITAAPVRHGGFRYGIDSDWLTRSATAYVVERNGLTVYFGGDTAYVREHFLETRRRFPHIDLALLPIGPIRPRAEMRAMHMDPEEALQAFSDLGAKRMIPIHFGTFRLSIDAPEEPLRELRAAMEARGLTEEQVLVLRIGEQVVLSPEKPHEPPPRGSFFTEEPAR